MPSKIELEAFRLLKVDLGNSSSKVLTEKSGTSFMTLGSNIQLNKQDAKLVRLLFFTETNLASLKLTVVSESRFKRDEEFSSEEMKSDETVKLLVNLILPKHMGIVKGLIENSGYKLEPFPDKIEDFEKQTVIDEQT